MDISRTQISLCFQTKDNTCERIWLVVQRLKKKESGIISLALFSLNAHRQASSCLPFPLTFMLPLTPSHLFPLDDRSIVGGEALFPSLPSPLLEVEAGGTEWSDPGAFIWCRTYGELSWDRLRPRGESEMGFLKEKAGGLWGDLGKVCFLFFQPEGSRMWAGTMC